MRERDPGSAPAINDRVPYVFVVSDNKKAIQAERVEHPDHVQEQGCKIDYGHYITNQIMEPVKQLFALVVEQLPGVRVSSLASGAQISGAVADEMRGVKEQKKREKEVERLLFQPALDELARRGENMLDISSFFG
jgi:hypothetical protein